MHATAAHDDQIGLAFLGLGGDLAYRFVAVAQHRRAMTQGGAGPVSSTSPNTARPWSSTCCTPEGLNMA